MNKHRVFTSFSAVMLTFFMGINLANAQISIAQSPLFFPGTLPPMNMLIMGRDHTLYYEAYNDASDLTGDGVLNVGYQPDKLDYFGYFDSHLCYTHDGNRFNPVASTSNKKCSGSGQWSGDFLNYVTTARIDALRKVLYGGRRIVDTESETVLERSYIPQDAHSWGKEYQSIARDGYDIRDYTPLSLPAAGTRHLLANTTLLKDDVMAPNRAADMAPLMRVLTDSRYRIWEWVAIERHVAGSRCVDGRNNNNPCVYSATTLQHSHPLNAAEFQSLIAEWGTETQKCGSGPIAGGNINTSGSDNNPFASAAHCGHDWYLTIIQGQIYIPATGDYQFATNGDDAVELRINGEVVSYWYGGHGRKSGTPTEIAEAIDDESNAHNGTVNLAAGWHDFEFRHEERTGGDNYQLLWQRPGQPWAIVPASDLRNPQGNANTAPIITTYSTERTIPASVMTDYEVRVRVCHPDFPESHCRSYGENNILKPVGLLQQYGEEDRMLFGLITGSYTHPYNMRGGILRKNIESFKDEVDLDTGIFDTDIKGIIYTLDRLRIVDFDAARNYEYAGGWLTNESMGDSSTAFPDWGNPIAEMMYESLRYFSGKENPTSEFMPSLSSGMENITVRHGDNMQLPAPDWQDPYTRVDQTTYYCSPGAQLVISDVNPSFDTEFVPGSAFSSFSGDISGLNAANEAQAIWNEEHGGSSLHFIGELAGSPDGTPTPKTVSSLGNIRGLAPSEPTRRGGYYAASVARYGFLNDLRDDLQGQQNINTFAVALTAPLPRLEIPLSDRRVSLIPFGKTVVAGSMSNAKGSFQPTTAIVDFFVEEFANTDPNGADANLLVNEGRPFVRFRINFEDVEQGADHDMDAIIIYELKVNSDDTLTVSVIKEYEAAGYTMNFGYVISGTNDDGVYLEVSSKTSNPSYFLNTPAGRSPGYCDVSSPPSDCINLLQSAVRTFEAGTGTAATLLENPLWYAAKYGSAGNEDLQSGEPSPNYFLVTNAGTLQQQLEDAFAAILGVTSSASAVATNSTRLSGDTLIYQARFRSDDWTGELLAFEINPDGSKGTQRWDAGDRIPETSLRDIFTFNPDAAVTANRGLSFEWGQLTEDQKSALNADDTDTLGEDRLNWLRGDQGQEQQNSGAFRDRSRVLGDIVNFNPVFVHAQNFGYTSLPGAEGSSYAGFVSDKRTNRDPILYVGTNAGMLHAIDANTGDERFAYVPNVLMSNLHLLSNPNYTHRYYVDGQAHVSDAYLEDEWRTVLLGSFGAGGRGVFALDITDPDNFDASHVLWEFTDPDLGHVMGEPSIARLKNGDWVAIFGNGYNSNSHQAFLFVVDLATGELRKKIATETGSGSQPNGLSTPALVMNSDRIITEAYAGDLLGNLWKFDLTGNNQSQWDSAFKQGSTPKPLFTAIGPDDLTQPITSRPEVVRHPISGNIVLFGTGQFFAVGDNIIHASDEPVQSLYGIRDNDSKIEITLLNRTTKLLEQTIVPHVEPEDPFAREVWVVSQNAMDWGEKDGWFLDLQSPAGERVIHKPIVRYDRVAFTLITPSDDPCDFGGSSRLVLLDFLTGGRLDYTPFDLNEDGEFDSLDFVQLDDDPNTGEPGPLVPVSIISLNVGIASQGTVIEAGPVEYLTYSGTSGEIESVKMKGKDRPRSSWRQLR